MNCADIQEKISLYIDNILDAQEKQLVEEHLSECKNCAQEYEMLKANIEALNSMQQVELPEGFRDELHSKLVAEQKKRKVNWRSYTVIAAAVLIMVVSALQNQFFDNKGITQSVESDESATRANSKWTLANDAPKSSDDMDLFMAENEESGALEMAAEPRSKGTAVEKALLLNDFEGYVNIKDESMESAIYYIEEYVNVSAYSTEINIEKADDGSNVKIELHVSSGGFDLLLDHITAYPNVTDFNVSVINMDEERVFTANSDATPNIALLETEPELEDEPNEAPEKNEQPVKQQKSLPNLDGGQEGTSTIIVEVTNIN